MAVLPLAFPASRFLSTNAMLEAWLPSHLLQEAVKSPACAELPYL